MFIEFGRFIPDQADWGHPGLTYGENIVPIARGYISVPGLATLGVTGITGIANALWYEREAQGTVFSFAADETKLYRQLAGSWTDVSRGAGYASVTNEDRWRHARFGDNVLAVNGKSNLQKFAMAAGDTEFSDGVSGAGAMQAKYIAIVRDQVFLGHCSARGAAENGTLLPYRVHWSAIGDPFDYEPSDTTQAGFQDIADLGEVRGVTGGEFATILLENGLVRADLSDPAIKYQFDQIEGSPGCFAPRSVIRVRNTTYWYSEEGWYKFDGQTATPIGAERVDRFFLLNQATLDTMSAADLPNISVIAWGYESANNPGDMKIDALLLYNYDINEWGYARVTGVDCIGSTGTAGFTVEDLSTISSSIDALPASLDSRLYKGGARVTGAIKSGELFTFTGGPEDGLWETTDFQPNEGGTSFIHRIVPRVQGSPTLQAQIGRKEAWNEEPIWSDIFDQGADGTIPCRGDSGRTHRIRVRASGSWTHATGTAVFAKETGKRGG